MSLDANDRGPHRYRANPALMISVVPASVLVYGGAQRQQIALPASKEQAELVRAALTSQRFQTAERLIGRFGGDPESSAGLLAHLSELGLLETPDSNDLIVDKFPDGSEDMHDYLRRMYPSLQSRRSMRPFTRVTLRAAGVSAAQRPLIEDLAMAGLHPQKLSLSHQLPGALLTAEANFVSKGESPNCTTAVVGLYALAEGYLVTPVLFLDSSPCAGCVLDAITNSPECGERAQKHDPTTDCLQLATGVMSSVILDLVIGSESAPDPRGTVIYERDLTLASAVLVPAGPCGSCGFSGADASNLEVDAPIIWAHLLTEPRARQARRPARLWVGTPTLALTGDQAGPLNNADERDEGVGFALVRRLQTRLDCDAAREHAESLVMPETYVLFREPLTAGPLRSAAFHWAVDECLLHAVSSDVAGPREAMGSLDLPWADVLVLLVLGHRELRAQGNFDGLARAFLDAGRALARIEQESHAAGMACELGIGGAEDLSEVIELQEAETLIAWLAVGEGEET